MTLPEQQATRRRQLNYDGSDHALAALGIEP